MYTKVLTGSRKSNNSAERWRMGRKYEVWFQRKRLWMCRQGKPQDSDEWLPAVNMVWFCDSGQWRVAPCCEQGMILWLRAVTSGCLLWTRCDYVIQGSNEWLPAVNKLWFCDLGQWRVAACCEQGMILWFRTVTSGCLLWTRYDSVTQGSDACLPAVNKVWFCDCIVVLSFSKMIVRN